MLSVLEYCYSRKVSKLPTNGKYPSGVVAAGSPPRARFLAADERLAHRQEAFASIPYRLDGAGSTVANIVDELFDRIDEASTPLLEQHALELKELEARVSLTGERGSCLLPLPGRVGHLQQALCQQQHGGAAC